MDREFLMTIGDIRSFLGVPLYPSNPVNQANPVKPEPLQAPLKAKEPTIKEKAKPSIEERKTALTRILEETYTDGQLNEFDNLQIRINDAIHILEYSNLDGWQEGMDEACSRIVSGDIDFLEYSRVYKNNAGENKNGLGEYKDNSAINPIKTRSNEKGFEDLANGEYTGDVSCQHDQISKGLNQKNPDISFFPNDMQKQNIGEPSPALNNLSKTSTRDI